MIKETITFNPFTNDLQKILNKETIAEKEHTHAIVDVNGLQTVLAELSESTGVKIKGHFLL